MSDSDKITYIRDQMPVTRRKVFLNTGTSGPLATRTTAAMQEEMARELEEGRAGVQSFRRFGEIKTALREAFARLVNARPAEIALTHHTTEGMNIVTHGLNWQPGDEVVTTTLEHEGGLLPLFVLKQRQGVTVKVVRLAPDDSPEEMVARLEEAFSPRTRLLVFSHVAWNTGQRLPLAPLATMARRHGVLTLVDGAQSAGAIPLDLPASGVDFYALPGQKWLCGPEGIGALYVRRERLALVAPTFAGYASLENPTLYDLTGYFLPARGARRFETGTVYRPAMRAMADNLDWLEREVGWEWVYGRIAHLFDYTRRALSDLPGVTLITPPGPQAGLLTFTLDGYDPARIVTRLAEQGIIIRFLPHPYALRVSTGFYNTPADIDRLIAALQDILAHSPDDLPPYTPPW